ncbi:MAG: hypothetical protein AB8H86_27850 [Polyangiales bacterium]
MARDEAELEGQPQGRARTLMLRVFFAFLAFQVVVPMTYYLRDDAYDERFAWRMFSAVRLHQCQTTASEDTGSGFETIRLARVIHNAWIRHLGRNRRDVVDAFLERRCDEENVQTVRVVNQCRGVAGEAYEAQVYERSCDDGDVTMPGQLRRASE